MVLVLILSTGFVFASLFAFLQVKAKHSVFHTGICGGIFALYLILLFYIDLTLLIDWNAVSEGEIQLTILPLYTTNFTEPLSYQDSAFLKLPKFP